MGESLSLFVTTVAIGIVLFVFFLLIKSYAPSLNLDPINEFSFSDSAKVSLEAYLKTPMNIEYGGENTTVTMAELIRLVKMNSSYEKFLEDESGKIFNEAYGASNYRLDIKDVFSIGKIEYISNPTQPDIAIQVPQGTYLDESSSTIKLPDIEVTLALKTK